MKINWNYPTCVWVGENRIKDLSQACKNLDISSPLFVTDKDLINLDMVKNIILELKKNFNNLSIFSNFSGNPFGENVEDGVNEFKKNKCDGVIAFGGGSGLDVGKAIAFMSGQSRPIWDFEDVSDYWKRANDEKIAPIIAVPTTAGTGSETGRASAIINKETGVKKIIIENLKATFVKEYVYPMIRGHALYEGIYFLGTSIARPLIAKRQIAIAKKYKAYAVSHGSTGKGNDQVRFELGYHYFGPKLKVIAPWRIWKLNSRTDLIKYAKKNRIPIPKDKKGAPPFSVDDNLFHTSTEGKVLENPKNQAPEYIFQRTTSPEKAPNKASYVTISFKNGDPITVNGKKLTPGNLLQKLNIVAGKNGIGRVDLVENRFIGIKSRGIYETPGGTLLMTAHRAIESVTLDKETMHKKDEIMPKYAELIYNGYWYSKARFKLQKIVDLKRNKVNGFVKLKLYKGNIIIISRHTKSSVYSMKRVSFEENKAFNKSNVERFINFHKKKLKN